MDLECNKCPDGKTRLSHVSSTLQHASSVLLCSLSYLLKSDSFASVLSFSCMEIMQETPYNTHWCSSQLTHFQGLLLSLGALKMYQKGHHSDHKDLNGTLYAVCKTHEASISFHVALKGSAYHWWDSFSQITMPEFWQWELFWLWFNCCYCSIWYCNTSNIWLQNNSFFLLCQLKWQFQSKVKAMSGTYSGIVGNYLFESLYTCKVAGS